MKRIHRMFARYVYRRTGFTHWSSGPGNYTFDPACPLCRLRAKLAPAQTADWNPSNNKAGNVTLTNCETDPTERLRDAHMSSDRP